MHELKQRLDERLWKAAGVDTDLLLFFLRRRFAAFDVPSAPFFDCDETVQWFLARLKTASRYLEYGTGGSTYAAAKLDVPFFAVESDPYFLRSVRNKIRQDGLARDDRQHFHYADIGLTGYVGYPFRHWRASPSRLERFRRYSDPPPACAAGGQLPDLVLVDGRFRVACALKALKLLKDLDGWSIVFDDYVNRPHYQVFGEFARIERYVGSRMAVFSGVHGNRLGELDRAIERYEIVPD